MKNKFFILIAMAVILSSCAKENAKKESGVNPTSNINLNHLKAANGRKFISIGAHSYCDTPPVACLPDVVVRPDAYCYLSFVDAIDNSTEHEFFASDEGRELFPILYTDEWSSFLAKAQDERNKLIKLQNEKTGTYYYNLVPDHLDPKDYKVGMESLTLPLIVE